MLIRVAVKRQLGRSSADECFVWEICFSSRNFPANLWANNIQRLNEFSNSDRIPKLHRRTHTLQAINLVKNNFDWMRLRYYSLMISNGLLPSVCLLFFFRNICRLLKFVSALAHSDTWFWAGLRLGFLRNLIRNRTANKIRSNFVFFAFLHSSVAVWPPIYRSQWIVASEIRAVRRSMAFT